MNLRTVFSLVVVLVMLGSTVPANAGAPSPGRTPLQPSGLDSGRENSPRNRGAGAPAVDGEVLVRFKPGSTAATKRALRSSVEATRERGLGLPGLELLTIDDVDVGEAIAALERRPYVLYAEPNYIYEAAEVPDDPDFDKLWGLDNTGQTVNGVPGKPDADIDAPEAWDVTTGSSDVVVAVVDTGVAVDHPDLAANMVAGRDFVDDDDDPFDFNGHGTHVAGTIGAEGNNTAGISGVNWNVSLMPLRVLNMAGFGSNEDITAAFTHAAENGAAVVNASLGGPGRSQAMADAIANAPDTLFVVAAGNEASNNDNDTTPSYPCNYTAVNLICVAATDSQDALAGFSNYGPASVDLAAPGTNTLSSIPNFETLFEEGFEDGTGWRARWTSGATDPSHDTWGRGEDEVGFFLADSPNGDYQNNTDTFVQTSAALDLTDLRGCQLHYWVNPRLRSGDFFRAEASTNGADWSQLSSLSGMSSGWFPTVDDLTDFDGEPQVFLRYRLTSNDDGLTAAGVSIDDITAACIPAGYDGDEYEYFNGTSMATPHVAGAAALLWGFDDSASVAAVRAALLDGVDVKASLDDRVATRGRLNAARSIAALHNEAPTNVSVSSFQVPFIKKKKLSVTISASDPHEIVSYALISRVAPYNGGFRAPRSKENAQAQRTVTVSPGSTACFSATATDTFGATSEESSQNCAAVPVNNVTFNHKRGWTKKKAKGYFLNTFSIARKKGSTLVLKGVRAKQLALVATRCKGCGAVKVMRGNKVLKKVRLRAPRLRKKRLIGIATFQRVTKGTIKIVVTSKGKPVRLEGLGVSKR